MLFKKSHQIQCEQRATNLETEQKTKININEEVIVDGNYWDAC